MATKDARSLPSSAQEDLRRRVVAAVRDGMRKAEAARVFGVSRAAIHNWMTAFEQRGSTALKARKRGRPKQSRLLPHEAATTVRLITDRCPDQLKFPFALWTREAVQQLLAERFQVEVSVWTVGRYLNRWGFTPQKPLRRAYERNPKAVEAWLESEYPQIQKRAKQENAEIHWGDEMGLRSDHQAGRSYGRRGQTPVIPGTGRRFGCNMISTITNRGRLAFMVFKERFTASVMVRFLKRLLKHSCRSVFLIVDSHPVHRSGKVQAWLAENRNRIRIFFLPAYSPDLNPDELLNQDVKTNAVGRRRPATQREMLSQVRSYLRSTQRQPYIVKSYFDANYVRYAAATDCQL